MKMYGGVEQYIHAFITSGLDGGEWSASCPGEITPITNWIWGWVGPTVGLKAVAKRKIPIMLCRELNHLLTAHNLVTIPTELSRLLACVQITELTLVVWNTFFAAWPYKYRIGTSQTVGTLCGPPSFLSGGSGRDSFPGGKATSAWSWSLTSIYVRG
jgi:hypothetical protein